MATRLKHRTVVFVGGGFTAALAARQLTAKGVDVVVVERGIDRTHTAATSLPSQRDELRWDVHGDLFQDWSVQTYTLRHNDGETALPIRRLQAFKPGEGMGGAANHWNGQTWRWSESDPVLRTHLQNRYGKKAIPAEIAIQDWGVTISSKSCSALPARQEICVARCRRAEIRSRHHGRTSFRKNLCLSPKRA